MNEMAISGGTSVDAANSMNERRVARVVTTPAPEPGFIGPGHEAVPVIEFGAFERNDPFIALMDDRVDLEPGSHAGEARPHAGFDVVTFLRRGRAARPR